jgi:type II secretory pathway pseudopilin PulG
MKPVRQITKNQPSQAGYTALELVVVLLIVIILVAILIWKNT